jgi:hypothetical protein
MEAILSPEGRAPHFGARVAVWFLSFGSIATMLGFLYGFAPMHVLGAFLLVPSLVGIGVVWLWRSRSGDDAFHTLMLIGLWGGIWGTLGYDLARVPLHYLGLNPFPPIRSYGMFVTGAQHATLTSDMVGTLYHFSNGVTFAWMYALIMSRRNFGWAVLWGLVLETLAVLTPFGSVYGIRTAYVALGVAYFAHLFYGLPLGWACENPKRTLQALKSRRLKVASLVTLGLVAVFLSTAYEKPWRAPEVGVGEIVVGPDAIYRGWTRVPVGGRLMIINAADMPLEVELRGVEPQFTLAPGQGWSPTLEEPGLFQLVVLGRPWRSAFVSVERDGYPLPGETTRKPSL